MGTQSTVATSGSGEQPREPSSSVDWTVSSLLLSHCSPTALPLLFHSFSSLPPLLLLSFCSSPSLPLPLCPLFLAFSSTSSPSFSSSAFLFSSSRPPLPLPHPGDITVDQPAGPAWRQSLTYDWPVTAVRGRGLTKGSISSFQPFSFDQVT